MTEILAVTVPFFALVVAGYVASWRHVLPESAIPGLNAFVLYFALPCMLFRFSAQTPFGELVNLPVFLAYMSAGLAMLGAFALLARFAVGETALVGLPLIRTSAMLRAAGLDPLARPV